jgi:hypothetical protein
VPLGDEGVEAARGLRFVCGEAVAEEVGFGGENGVGFALVGGEVADEGEDVGDILRCGGAEGKHVSLSIVGGWEREGTGRGVHPTHAR